MKKLRRPLALVGIVIFLSMAAVRLFGLAAGLGLGAVCAAAAAVAFGAKDKNAALACGLAAAASLLSTGLSANVIAQERDVLERCAGRESVITAVVTDYHDYDNVTLVYAQISQVDGKNITRFETSFFLEDYVEIGDGITARVVFDAGRNPYRDDLAVNCHVKQLLGVTPGKNGLRAVIARARSYVTRIVTTRLPGEEGGVAAALITGDKNLLPVALRQDFNRAGISHILVVSGLHITLIIGLLYGLFERLRAARWLKFLSLILLLGGCLFFYGATPSVTRACVMCLIVYGSRLMWRRYDPATALGLAAAFVLLCDPSAAADVSFLLSFGCCVAMLLIYPRWKENRSLRFKKTKTWWDAWLCRAADALLLSASISLISLPVLILYNMPLSLVSPLTNLAILWLVTTLVPFAFLICLPAGPLSALFGLAAGICIKIIITVAHFFASFSLAAVATGAPYLKIWLAFGGAVLAICAFYKKERAGRGFVAACIIFVLLIGVLSRLAFTLGTPVVTLYRDQAVIVQDDGRAIVVVQDINADGVDYLVSYLRYRYIDEVTYVMITDDVGREAERRLCAYFPEASVWALYETDTSGVENFDHEKIWQGLGRFRSLTAWRGGSVEIEIDDLKIQIFSENREATQTGTSGFLIERIDTGGIDCYYLVDGSLYRADSGIQLYISGGRVRPVME